VHGAVPVFVALAYSIPSAFAAYFSWRGSRDSSRTRQDLVTGNDKTVGEMVTEVHGKESDQGTGFQTHRLDG
jgi:hypothetical protein